MGKGFTLVKIAKNIPMTTKKSMRKERPVNCFVKFIFAEIQLKVRPFGR